MEAGAKKDAAVAPFDYLMHQALARTSSEIFSEESYKDSKSIQFRYPTPSHTYRDRKTNQANQNQQFR